MLSGLMPHPERAVEAALGSTDGLVIFRSMVESLVAHREQGEGAPAAERVPA